ncbi:diacylglycerol/lipid kinase family protein [Effusibacillus lacus]|uniref:Lipid kinase n=1 Tax=Effusibacillus lacus TaxID=1348429 RepID=A0A292YPM9_9BACL|nr:diacylglycerol kinase family protein [Effusibacillus lacus]TCS71079.1 YegS/Rv2252/BmrU family lipid kinase [Effusibacillus lacus]GAX90723.1 lipid kinase [Effusibacillus lacus]
MERLFIVNEHAGKGKTKKRWPMIQRHLDTFGIRYDARFTSKPKEAIEIAKKAVHHYSQLIAVGGDGTVNEVVNGIAGQGTLFGLMPTGTGNDLARTLHIPDDPYLAVRCLANGTHHPMDLLDINGFYVAGAIGIGLDGAVATDINLASWKKKTGTVGYILSMLKLLLTFPPFAVSLQIDDQAFFFPNCWLVAIGNSKYYGGGMKICPQAVNNDGVLDLCVVHNLSRIELLKIFPSVFHGMHVLHPNVLCFQGKKVRVTTERPVPIHGDGEILGNTPSVIVVRPHILNVLFGS